VHALRVLVPLLELLLRQKSFPVIKSSVIGRSCMGTLKRADPAARMPDRISNVCPRFT